MHQNTKVRTRAILLRTRNLLATEGSWTQGALARDKMGNVTKLKSENATCFCLVGAVRRAEIEDTHPREVAAKLINLEINANTITGDVRTATWNDTRGRTQGEVIDVIDRAINRLDGIVTTHNL